MILHGQFLHISIVLNVFAYLGYLARALQVRIKNMRYTRFQKTYARTHSLMGEREKKNCFCTQYHQFRWIKYIVWYIILQRWYALCVIKSWGCVSHSQFTALYLRALLKELQIRFPPSRQGPREHKGLTEPPYSQKAARAKFTVEKRFSWFEKYQINLTHAYGSLIHTWYCWAGFEVLI